MKNGVLIVFLCIAIGGIVNGQIVPRIGFGAHVGGVCSSLTNDFKLYLEQNQPYRKDVRTIGNEIGLCAQLAFDSNRWWIVEVNEDFGSIADIANTSTLVKLKYDVFHGMGNDIHLYTHAGIGMSVLKYYYERNPLQSVTASMLNNGLSNYEQYAIWQSSILWNVGFELTMPVVNNPNLMWHVALAYMYRQGNSSHLSKTYGGAKVDDFPSILHHSFSFSVGFDYWLK
ncbi:MAG: hypothetical protein IJ684_00725 [Bacteroidales bacterium]|nr:hypothetical protein [Bacteroidales bacterium]